MDLLCNAYSNASDDEAESEPEIRTPQLQFRALHPSKRPKLDYPNQNPDPNPIRFSSPPSLTIPRIDSSAPGRYVSKRERALLASVSATSVPDLDPDTNPNPMIQAISSPVLGSITDSNLPHDVLSLLRNRPKAELRRSRIPARLSIALPGHTKAVSAIDWSRSYAHLLASSGLDNAVCIWNVWSKGQKKVRLFNFHNAPVKDVKWSPQGLSVLSCGYDCSTRLVDVEKGLETQIFKEDQVVGVVKFHPENSNLFLSGGSKGHLRLWDMRTEKVVHHYSRGLGPILDVEFFHNGKQFISSSDVSSGNNSENAIMVWDVSREVPLSNQVYAEAFTCPSIRHHPFDQCFVTQSNGNYIAIFSSNAPFKLNKYKRYEGHWVSGFPVKCSFSLDGDKLVSGSSDGSIYFYNYRTSELIRKIKAYGQPCIDVSFHPIMPNVIASCSWSGDVSVFE